MSVEAISWALNDAPVDNPTSKLVLIALANHARPDGSSSFPSVARLCRYTCLSERSVRLHLAGLEQQGIIERCDQRIVAAYIDRPDRRPVGYNLCITLKRGVQDVQAAAERGASDEPNGVQEIPERGAGGAPKPLLNRQQEPLEAAPRASTAKELAEEFVDSLMLNKVVVRARPKTTAKDVQAIEKLLAQGLTVREIRAVFTAAHRDGFWHRVISSPSALGKHFDRLAVECDVHDVETAWTIVKEAIADHGYMNRPQFTQPAIQAAVDEVGWRNLCLSTSVDARKAFEQAMRKTPV